MITITGFRFKEDHRELLRDVEIEEVEKMLACGDPDGGFTTYGCPVCGSIQRLPFTCKSRICTSCGKKHADKWAIRLR